MPKIVFANHETREVSTPEENPGKHLVNKYLYLLLIVLLGPFGFHKFYARKWVQGLLYLAFWWTMVPIVLCFFDFVNGAGAIRDPKDRIWI